MVARDVDSAALTWQAPPKAAWRLTPPGRRREALADGTQGMAGREAVVEAQSADCAV